MKPQFFIIAGPNGAGKSTYVHDFVPADTVIFNGDQVYADLLKQYPNYDPVALAGGVPFRLEKERDAAISAKRNFCFESNYSNDLATEIAETFKAADYEINLIYFGLNDIDVATSRVMTRVALGGHDIKDMDIRYNFEDGILRVKQDLALYDSIQFVDTNINQSATVIAHYVKDESAPLVIHQSVSWFENHFRLRMEALHIKTTKQTAAQKDKQSIKHRKGRRL